MWFHLVRWYITNYSLCQLTLEYWNTYGRDKYVIFTQCWSEGINDGWISRTHVYLFGRLIPSFSTSSICLYISSLEFVDGGVNAIYTWLLHEFPISNSRWSQADYSNRTKPIGCIHKGLVIFSSEPKPANLSCSGRRWRGPAYPRTVPGRWSMMAIGPYIKRPGRYTIIHMQFQMNYSMSVYIRKSVLARNSVKSDFQIHVHRNVICVGLQYFKCLNQLFRKASENKSYISCVCLSISSDGYVYISMYMCMGNGG